MFTIKTRFGLLQELCYNRIPKMQAAIVQAEVNSADSLKARLIKLSSGPYSTAFLQQQARLRGAGLYSRRSPAPPTPAYILNRQSGSIADGWDVRVSATVSGNEINVTNRSPHFQYMAGTNKMIARPIVEKAQEQERFARLARLAKARLSILKP